jgi:hypothetical protein
MRRSACGNRIAVNPADQRSAKGCKQLRAECGPLFCYFRADGRLH